MARMPRLVVPGHPHHVTQRGVRRMRTFFCDDDYQMYIDLIAEGIKVSACSIWAYCLMPNHVHLVVVPEHKDSLAQLFRYAHLRYTRAINDQKECQGHLWQERFHSFVMDEHYLAATVRYVELNPVRAELCSIPEEWPWSSVHAHLARRDDKIVTVRPMLNRISDWPAYLSRSGKAGTEDSIRQHTGTGRPLGSNSFLDQLEATTGRALRKQKPGPR